MKLLIATGLYPPDIGGPATYTVFLEKHAASLGIELIVVPFGTVRHYPPLIRHLVYIMKLFRAARTCDVIYALDTMSVGVPACIVSFLTRKPLLLRVPGDYAWEQGQQRFGITETLDEYRVHPETASFPVRVLAWLQTRVARRATRVVVPSEYMKGVVAGWGVDPERITRIYSVLNNLESPDATEERDSDPRNEFVVATAARLVPWKGMHTLIDVIAALRTEAIPVRLHIFGDGVCRKELEERTRVHGASEYIQFFGAVPRAVLGTELKRAHAFVLNTSYEGLSHQLIEVMSLGVPIVTTPVGGNVELIIHEASGLLVPFDDHAELRETLRRLYHEPALRDRLRAHAQRSIERFREEVVIEECVRLFTLLEHTSEYPVKKRV